MRSAPTTCEPADANVSAEGATVFTRFPPEPALGRPAEVVALALAYSYRQQLYAPRGRPAIGELVGLDDLARALPFTGPEEEPHLGQVAGEIRTDSIRRVIDDLDE
jgi:hypothetical protein